MKVLFGMVLILATVFSTAYIPSSAGKNVSQTSCACDPVRDSLALVALFNATNGPEWYDNENWLMPGIPIDEWEFVTTNAEGCVTKLEIDGYNNLNGFLPPEIGMLQDLDTLNISGSPGGGTNQNLGGNIPAEVGNLVKLRYLRFAHNQLSGPIPEELQNLVQLEVLRMADNHLSGNIPSFLGSLTNLRTLHLYSNQFIGSIPAELGNLNDLESLQLSDNQLTGPVPAELGGLMNLFTLWLNNNQLSGTIPPELGNLNLTDPLWIQLDSNQLSGCFPPELSSFCDLIPPSGNSIISFTRNPGLPGGGDFMAFCQEGAGSGDNKLTILDSTICAGEMVRIGNAEYSETGIHTEVLPTAEGCDSTIELHLTVLPLEEADAGEGRTLCDPNTQLSAVAPTLDGISGRWESVNSNAVIDDPNNPNSQVFELEPGANQFRWVLSRDACAAFDSDLVTIFYEDKAAKANEDSYFVYDFEGVFNGNVLENDTYSDPIEIELLEKIEGLDTIFPDGSFSYFFSGASPKIVTSRYRITFENCPGQTSEGRIVIRKIESGVSEPTVVTPNGDGHNDEFFVPELQTNPQDYPKNELVVFNRWGQVVFQAGPYNNDWDGTHMKTGERLHSGTYYYVLRLDLGSGKVRIGEVTIIR